MVAITALLSAQQAYHAALRAQDAAEQLLARAREEREGRYRAEYKFTWDTASTCGAARPAANKPFWRLELCSAALLTPQLYVPGHSIAAAGALLIAACGQKAGGKGAEIRPKRDSRRPRACAGG